MLERSVVESWRSEGFGKKWRWGKCCRVVLEGGVLQRNVEERRGEVS